MDYQGISKGIKQPDTQCSLPSSITTLFEVSLRTRGLRALHPQAENTATQKCAADFRSDEAYSVGVRLSAFFPDLGCE